MTSVVLLGGEGAQGRAGAPGPAGVAGVQGVPGPSGLAWLYQPTPAELVANVKDAVLDLSPRTLLSPRSGLRYVGAVATRLIKLQGGLLLRALVTTDTTSNPVVRDQSHVRSIA